MAKIFRIFLLFLEIHIFIIIQKQISRILYIIVSLGCSDSLNK